MMQLKDHERFKEHQANTKKQPSIYDNIKEPEQLAKMYRVLITWKMCGDMYINAHNGQEAREIAEELANAGAGEILDIDANGGVTAEYAHEIKNPADLETKNAKENEEDIKAIRKDS